MCIKYKLQTTILTKTRANSCFWHFFGFSRLHETVHTFTSFQTKTISLEQVQFSAEKLFSFFCRDGKKNAVFWPKIGQKIAKFSKNFGIDKNHINTSYDRFLGHLVDFWPKNGHFRLFLGLFWPI